MKDEASHQDIAEAIKRIDALREVESKHIDEKFRDTKEYFVLSIADTVLASNQRFEAQQLALKDALIAQEKAVAAALAGTKEAIIKNDANTDKRFDLLSEKIDSIADTINKSTGAQGIYVTHSDLSTEMEKLRISFEGMLRPVVSFMNSAQGGKAGVSSAWGYVVGSVGLVSTVILLGLRLSGN
jgi:hypothetical protein